MLSKDMEKPLKSSASCVEAGKVPKEVLLVAQQIKIARSLASNDLRVRTKQLKRLKRWLNIRANSSFPFSNDDFLRVWKGLFYCMWMSDKPLVQESLAEDFGSLLACFSNPEVSAEFFGCFLESMSIEWFGIDHWRMDKFLMLIRRMLRHMFSVLKDAKWKKRYLLAFNKHLKAQLFKDHEALGLTMHVLDIYLDELAKVADGDVSSGAVNLLVKPFIKFLAKQNDYKMLAHIRRNIFYQLLWQSNLGREFSDKFEAWKLMGFPTENIDDLEKVEEESDEDELVDDDESSKNEEVDEENSENQVLDPRAGCVDVIIPELPFNVQPFITEFEKLQFDDITTTKSRKFIREILRIYKIYQTGEFPLGVKKIPRIQFGAMKPMIKEKVEELEKFEEELMSTTRQLKKLSKKKRKKILHSVDLNNDAVNEENFEKFLSEAISAKKPKLSPASSWKEEDASYLEDNLENIHTLREKMTKKQKKIQATLLNRNSRTPTTKKQKKNQQKNRKLNNVLSTTNGPAKSSDENKISSDENSLTKKRKRAAKDISLNAENKSKQIRQEPAETKSKEGNQDNTTHSTTNGSKSEWDKPLEEGEIEYFVPSRKLQTKKANKSLQEDVESTSQQSNLVLNPFAKNKIKKRLAIKNQLLGKGLKKAQRLKNIEGLVPTTTEKKKVKIALQKNSAQKPCEYIKQVLSSPQVPFDAAKKPTKSLLKPNLIPSPINPFYKKKIGLKINENF